MGYYFIFYPNHLEVFASQCNLQRMKAYLFMHYRRIIYYRHLQ